MRSGRNVELLVVIACGGDSRAFFEQAHLLKARAPFLFTRDDRCVMELFNFTYFKMSYTSHFTSNKCQRKFKKYNLRRVK